MAHQNPAIIAQQLGSSSGPLPGDGSDVRLESMHSIRFSQ